MSIVTFCYFHCLTMKEELGYQISSLSFQFQILIIQ